MNHYVYKLIAPRPTFAGDMNEAEMAVMGEHTVYWNKLFEDGRVAVFGVVLEPTGAWGLAVVEAETEDDVRALAYHDPAVNTGTCTFEIGVMPSPSVRPAQVAA
ncbi:MAG TPA: YciI family protein [Acidimicrobiales bacterium]|nr:YciI family protein [Acidimicrobiales bacterium]